jgi:hypothetical protein
MSLTRRRTIEIAVKEICGMAQTKTSAEFKRVFKIIDDLLPLNLSTRIESGVCRYCDCTDDAACFPPCSWIDPQHTVCSAEPCVRKWVTYLKKQVRMAEKFRGF